MTGSSDSMEDSRHEQLLLFPPSKDPSAPERTRRYRRKRRYAKHHDEQHGGLPLQIVDSRQHHEEPGS